MRRALLSKALLLAVVLATSGFFFKPSPSECGARAETDEFGLEVGRRLRYVQDGRVTAEIEMVEGEIIDGTPTRLLRGGVVEPLSSDVYVSWTPGVGLRTHAFLNGDRPLIFRGGPELLIPAELKPQMRWNVGDLFEAEVDNRESISTPSGTYDAWPIRYTRTESSVNQRTTLWFVPTVGVVRFELDMGTSGGWAQHYVHDLASIDQHCPSGKPPTESPDAIEVAANIPAEADVLSPVSLDFRIRNVGDAPVYVLPALDGSFRGNRRPRFAIEILDERGEPLPRPRATIGCGFENGLEASDFRLLEPGEELNPLGPRSFGGGRSTWFPTEGGRYTISLIYDTSGDESLWSTDGGGPPSSSATALLKQLARGVWRSAPKTIEVHDPPIAGLCGGPPHDENWPRMTDAEDRLHFALYDAGFQGVCISVQGTPQRTRVTATFQKPSSPEAEQRATDLILATQRGATRARISVRAASK